MYSQTKVAVLLIPLSMLCLNSLRLLHFTSHLLPMATWRTPLLHRWKTAPPASAALDDSNYDCSHTYSIELLSIDPLVIYINDFLKEEEIHHLLSEKENEFERSTVYDDDQNTIVDDYVRTSQSTYFDTDDIVVKCLSRRMMLLLGNVQHVGTEPVQMVKYEGGKRFRIHVDWLSNPLQLPNLPDAESRAYNRLGSIFAYLESNCTGGETYFPELPGVSSEADGTKYSRTADGLGLVVKPKRGSALFWNNLHSDGTGDMRVAHAGLPVQSGRKIGINIWSYYLYDTPLIGGT